MDTYIYYTYIHYNYGKQTHTHPYTAHTYTHSYMGEHAHDASTPLDNTANASLTKEAFRELPHSRILFPSLVAHCQLSRLKRERKKMHSIFK